MLQTSLLQTCSDHLDFQLLERLGRDSGIAKVPVEWNTYTKKAYLQEGEPMRGRTNAEGAGAGVGVGMLWGGRDSLS